jgi:hypothetical protein
MGALHRFIIGFIIGWVHFIGLCALQLSCLRGLCDARCPARPRHIAAAA